MSPAAGRRLQLVDHQGGSNPGIRPRRGSDQSPAIALVTAVVATMAACTESPDQREVGSQAADIRGSDDLADPYDGPYSRDFHTDVQAYVGQDVTLEAAVERIVSPIAFTVTGPGGEEVEPILVISRREVADLQPGQEVVIVAVPHDGFELSSLEEELDVELPEEPYEEWEGEPYLRGDAVDTSSSAG